MLKYQIVYMLQEMLAPLVKLYHCKSLQEETRQQLSKVALVVDMLKTFAEKGGEMSHEDLNEIPLRH